MNNSINIKGLIFQFEEEALITFRNYQKAVRTHFSTYEDSEEIIDDIELRFAELFHDYLEKDNRKIIENSDVENIMKSMGSISDFEEMDEELPSVGERKLFRDSQRKMVFGVASGLANYLKIDPAWIRFIFASLSFIGIGVVLYLLLTLIMPISDDLEEVEFKKLFRNSDEKVVGGVAAGLAHCFGVDATWFRLAFVGLAVLGGIGFIAYFILMAIIPEAKTASEKTEMSGNPITLSNIEKSLKANLGQSENQENVLLKFVLLPLKILTQLISNSETKKGKKVLNIARIVVGFGLLVASSSVLFGGVIFGLLGAGYFNDMATYFPEAPINLVASTIPDFMAFSGFVLSGFISLLILFLSISLLSNKPYVRPWVYGITFLLILFSGATFGVSGILLATDFKEEFSTSTEEIIQLGDNKEIGINLLDNGRFWDRDIEFEYTRTDGENIRIEKVVYARAYDSLKAKEYQEGINHYYKLEGSQLNIDFRFLLNEGTPFRNQKLKMVVYIPRSIKVIP